MWVALNGSGPRTVVAAGYVALDIILRNGEVSYRAGGTAVNVASNLSFLGWSASLIGLVGDDRAGRELHRDVGRTGVDAFGVTTRPGLTTPSVFHEIDENSHRYLFSCPVCGRRLGRHVPLSVQEVTLLVDGKAAPDIFFFDRPSASNVALAQRYREQGSLVVFEPSTKGHAHLFAQAAELAHIVKYSAERGMAFAELLHQADVSIEIVTLGPDGARIRSGDGHTTTLPAFGTQLVDAAGAGDWTTAGILAALPSLRPARLGRDIESALRLGQALGSLSCAFAGARGLSESLRIEHLRTAAHDLMQCGELQNTWTSTLSPSEVPEAACRCLGEF